MYCVFCFLIRAERDQQYIGVFGYWLGIDLFGTAEEQLQMLRWSVSLRQRKTDTVTTLSNYIYPIYKYRKCPDK